MGVMPEFDTRANRRNENQDTIVDAAHGVFLVRVSHIHRGDDLPHQCDDRSEKKA
jgi:hypothetical protein